MSVVRFIKTISPPASGRDERGLAGAADVVVARLEMPGDRMAVVSLADEARSGSVSFSAPGLLAELESRSGREIVAWIAWRPAMPGRRPVGLVMLARTAAGFSIPWLLVDPDARRRGVARALVVVAEDHARRRGASSITAETLASWPESIAFWPAVGFVRKGIVDDAD
jgi:GNAT superfamily N-acetyltransferase